MIAKRGILRDAFQNVSTSRVFSCWSVSFGVNYFSFEFIVSSFKTTDLNLYVC